MQKTMLSKFPGTCGDCRQPVAQGSTIVYHGRGRGISCAKCAGIAVASDGPKKPLLRVLFLVR